MKLRFGAVDLRFLVVWVDGPSGLETRQPLVTRAIRPVAGFVEGLRTGD